MFAQDQMDQEAIDLLEKSTLSYQNGDFEQSATEASKAFQEAKRLNNSILKAKALNQEGLALLKIDSRFNKNRREARRKFKESLALLTHIQESALRLNSPAKKPGRFAEIPSLFGFPSNRTK